MTPGALAAQFNKKLKIKKSKQSYPTQGHNYKKNTKNKVKNNYLSMG